MLLASDPQDADAGDQRGGSKHGLNRTGESHYVDLLDPVVNAECNVMAVTVR